MRSATRLVPAASLAVALVTVPALVPAAAPVPVRLLMPVRLLATVSPAAASDELSPEQARARVEYHLRQAEELSHHFETVLARECPRFASPGEWKSYLDAEVDRVVLLLAHVEQAWVEAKRTGDDDVRREAKAPRRRVDEARTLVDKLQACAGDNGARFETLALWQKIGREVPQRQAEITLPQ